MSSFRQIHANRLNAQRSTGPVTEAGKKRSRRNAVRHGLTAETVIDALEDAEDYAAFEMAITADYDAQTAVERELTLRLASVLWRLRRATAIESGLFKIQARHLLRFRQTRQAHQQRQEIIAYSNAVATEPAGPGAITTDRSSRADEQLPQTGAGTFDAITRSYVRLANLPACPLDRLNRYEATLWRQACQLLFTLGYLNRRSRMTGIRFSTPNRRGQ